MEKSILRIIRAVTLLAAHVEFHNQEDVVLKEMEELLNESADEVSKILEGKDKMLKDLEKEPETKYDHETLEAVIKELGDFDETLTIEEVHGISKAIRKIENMKGESA